LGWCRLLPYLEVRGLTKRYGRVVAVDRLSFRVDRGVHGVVGPNGSGKTTTLKSIVGLVIPDAGEVVFNGVNLLSKNGWRLRRLIGYVAEVPVLPGDYRVSELLEELAVLEGLSRIEAMEAARRALEEVGLQEKAEYRVSALSKGERKRLYFAQAILQPRELYVFDEPFSGLDPEAVAWARTLIARLSREAIIVMSSHILRELEELANTVTVIYRGRSLFTGTLEQLASTMAKGLTVEVSVDRAEEAVKLLKESGYNAAVSAGKLVVNINSRSEAADIVSLLASRGFRVYETRVRSISLEEAYMKLIASAGRKG
jgi:ABC-2 type transport system ATP-binding protein